MTTDVSLPLSRLPRQDVRSTILAVGLLAVAAALRVVGLGDDSLWLDEAFSVLYARLDWAEIIELRRTGTNPPLYHFLLAGWVRLFGNDEALLRLPSCLFGVASVGLLFGFARRLLNTRTALVAAALLCVNSMAVVQAQEARFYALTEMLSIGTTWAFYAWMIDQRRRGAVTYILLMTVFVWTHTFAWFVVAAHAMWWAWHLGRKEATAEQRRRILRIGLFGFGMVAGLFLPWTSILVSQIRGVLEGYWIARPTPAAPVSCLYAFLAPTGSLAYPTALIAIAVALRALVRRGIRHETGEAVSARRDTNAAPVPLLVAWLVAPTVLPLAWSFVGTPIFQVKYTVVAQPAALILFAWFATQSTVPAMIVLAGVSFVAPRAEEYPRVVEQWRTATSIVTRHARADAPVYIYREYCCFALTYYFPDSERITPVYPDGQRRIDFQDYYPNPAIPFSEMMRRLGDDAREAWMVVARVRERAEKARFHRLLEQLETVRPVVAHWALRGVDVVQLGSHLSAVTDL